MKIHPRIWASAVSGLVDRLEAGSRVAAVAQETGVGKLA
jgi:hypothetical protein